MAFALNLRYGPPPTLPLCIHSTMRTTRSRTTKLSFSSSHSSLSLSSHSTCRPLGHVFNPTIRAVDRSSMPSTNDKDDNKIGRGTVGASLIFACALGIIGCCSRMNRKAIATPPPMPAMTDTVRTIPAVMALKSFLLEIEHLAPHSGPDKSKSPSKLPKMPIQKEVDNFKMVLLRKIKSGKANEAITQLQHVIKQRDLEPETAFNWEMALVEIYILQGKYEEALECNCLKDDHRSLTDKRITLYKAIAHTMLAKDLWEEITGELTGSLSSQNININ